MIFLQHAIKQSTVGIVLAAGSFHVLAAAPWKYLPTGPIAGKTAWALRNLSLSYAWQSHAARAWPFSSRGWPSFLKGLIPSTERRLKNTETSFTDKIVYAKPPGRFQ
eukprot:g70939.t1